MTTTEACLKISEIMRGEPRHQFASYINFHAMERIVWGAVANARNHGPVGTVQPRWVCVRDALGVGSTVATLLCHAAGFNPDDEMRREPRDGEEE